MYVFLNSTIYFFFPIVQKFWLYWQLLYGFALNIHIIFFSKKMLDGLRSFWCSWPRKSTPSPQKLRNLAFFGDSGCQLFLNDGKAKNKFQKSLFEEVVESLISGFLPQSGILFPRLFSLTVITRPIWSNSAVHCTCSERKEQFLNRMLF